MSLVGDRLKEVREMSGMTKIELGKKSGISSQSIGYYESGKSDPSFFNICCLSDALHVSLDYLAGREDAGSRYLIDENMLLMKKEEASRKRANEYRKMLLKIRKVIEEI